jgi:hypothetical protein
LNQYPSGSVEIILRTLPNTPKSDIVMMSHLNANVKDRHKPLDPEQKTEKIVSASAIETDSALLNSDVYDSQIIIVSSFYAII